MPSDYQLAATARLQKANADAIIYFLVIFTAANANIANTLQVFIQLLFINKDTFQDDTF